MTDLNEQEKAYRNALVWLAGVAVKSGPEMESAGVIFSKLAEYERLALPVSPAPTPPSREAVERLRVELAKHDDGADNFLIDAVRNLLTVPPVPATASDAEMRPSEAVLMFGAWLTTRDEVAGPFSGHHDASQMAELVAEYAKRQGWLPVRDDWLRSASASVEPVVTEVLTTEDWEWLNKASSSEMSPLYPKGLAATCKRILAALSQQGGGK